VKSRVQRARLFLRRHLADYMVMEAGIGQRTPGSAM
jgi:hypothetical protein